MKAYTRTHLGQVSQMLRVWVESEPIGFFAGFIEAEHLWREQEIIAQTSLLEIGDGKMLRGTELDSYREDATKKSTRIASDETPRQINY